MVRYGIAGFGLHGVKRLIPGFLKASNSKLTAIARRDARKASEDAQRFSIPHHFATTKDLCACPDVDVVFVSSPNSVHFTDVMTCIEARKPILCEKPFAMDTNEARQMVDAARTAKVPLGVAHVFRFEHSVNRIREIVASGILGQIVMVRLDFLTWAVGHARKWVNDPKVAGGGPIADVGVHCIDTLRYVLGEDPVEVSTSASHDDFFREVEGSAALNLKFRSGILGRVAVSFRAQYRTPFEIVGTERVLRVEDALTIEKPVHIEVYEANGVLASRETVDNAGAYAWQVDAFSRWIEGGEAFPAPGIEGLKNQVILDAAYRSVKTGAAEVIDFGL